MSKEPEGLKFKVWLDSGANIHSKYSRTVTLPYTQEEWDEMSEKDKDDEMREIAFERMDWGYEQI